MKQLPIKIKSKLTGFIEYERIIGRLGNEIIKYRNNEGKTAYLKMGSGLAATSLNNESNILLWLETKNINSPRVMVYDSNENVFYLLITEIPGQPIHKLKHLGTDRIVKLLAKALKDFHNTDKNGAFYTNILERDLDLIGKYLKQDLINRDKFITNNQGKSPEEIFKYLNSNKNLFDNNVLTHGDYCLPNVIVNNDKYGFIDLGDCGVGDKYKDFSSMEVSIKRNLGEEWIECFYESYDQNLQIDREKIMYYQLIDQFDYCLNIKPNSEVFLLS